MHQNTSIYLATSRWSPQMPAPWHNPCVVCNFSGVLPCFLLISLFKTWQWPRIPSKGIPEHISFWQAPDAWSVSITQASGLSATAASLVGDTVVWITTLSVKEHRTFLRRDWAVLFVTRVTGILWYEATWKKLWLTTKKVQKYAKIDQCVIKLSSYRTKHGF